MRRLVCLIFAALLAWLILPVHAAAIYDELPHRNANYEYSADLLDKDFMPANLRAYAASDGGSQ